MDLPADVLGQRDLWREVAATGFRAAQGRALGVDVEAARAVERARAQLARDARADRSGDDLDHRVRRAVLFGFPDKVARRASGTALEAVMVGGRGLTLPRSVQAADTELLLALRVMETKGARAALSAYCPVEAEWLEELGTTTEDSLSLDEQGRVQALRRTRYLDLVLREVRVEPARDAVVDLLRAELRKDPWRHLGEQKELHAFLARVEWLRAVAPDLGVPELGDAAVAEAAGELCVSIRHLRDLRDADVLGVLQGQLPHALRQRLHDLAPAKIRLPSGRQATVQYDREQGPTVASRLQDFLGLSDTPRIAGGRVSLCLQLLAPNQRPVQVTRDLASFWANIYPKVRSELRRRYPRHAWPEDPLQPFAD